MTRQLNTKSLRPLTIRTARPGDAGAINAIKREIVSQREYMLVEPDEANYSNEREAEKIKRYDESPGSLYLVAETDGEVIGYLDFANGHLRRTAHSGMFAIFIAQQWREDGIGALMVSELLEWASANPLIEKVTLAVFSTNERARALYNKMGFKVEGECPRDMKIDDRYVDSVLMYKFVS